MIKLTAGGFRLFAFANLAFFIFPALVLAQVGELPSLIPYRKGDLWGYADSSRRIVIKPVFEEATLFQGSIARVKKNQKWGLINRQGAFVAEPEYDELHDFSGNQIGFRDNTRQGFLDTLGRETIILPPGDKIQTVKYTPAGDQDFVEDRAIVYGKDIANPEGSYYYLDRTGRRLTSLIITETRPFRRGTAVINTKDAKGFPRKTVIDKNGRDLLPLTYELHDTASFNRQPCFVVRTRSHFNLNKRNEPTVNYKRNYRFGLIDNRGEVLVPVTQRALLVKDGFVMVYDWFGKGALWDLHKKQAITRYRFDYFETTSRPARAAVSSLNKQGLLDSSGRFIIPLEKQILLPETQYQYSFRQFKSLGLTTPNFYYLLKDGKETAVDPYGKPLRGFHLGVLERITDSLILVKQYRQQPYNEYPFHPKPRPGNPKLGLMDTRGNVLVNTAYTYNYQNALNDQVILGNDSLVSYFTGTGKKLADRTVRYQAVRTAPILPKEEPKVIPPAELAPGNRNACYYLQQQLPNGYSLVANTCRYHLKSYGLIDAAGKVILPFHYNEIFPLSVSTLAVRQANKWGVLNMNGETILPLIHDGITRLANGSFLTGERNNQTNLIYTLRDSAGKITATDKLLEVPAFKANTAWIKTEAGQLELDRTGKILNRKPFTNQDASGYAKSGLIKVYENWKAGFVDTTGKVVIPFRYDQVKPFREGLAAVSKGGKWGYIDRTGKVVVPFQYSLAHPFSEGKAFVRTDAGYQVISRTGKILFTGNYQEVSSFSEGLAAVNAHKLWGFVNAKGQLAIPYKFDRVSEFTGGMAIYTINSGQGYLDKNGIQVVPPRYSLLQPFQNNFGWMRKDNTWYKVDRNGTKVDSTTSRPAVANPKTWTFSNHPKLYRHNRDGSETLLGEYINPQQETEGLIGTVLYNNVWYYADEKGNAYFEE